MSTQLILEILRGKQIELAPGLSEAETQRAEAFYNFHFPPDLRELLQTALPVGPKFPNWRLARDSSLAEMMKWPLRGMLFDIERNGFWVPEWGDKPEKLSAAFKIARRRVAKAPKLIPIYAHRFLPAEPCESGNPIFSVYQTDIIYYGGDLLEYFQNELLKQHNLAGYGSTIRKIPLWSALAGDE